MLVYGRYECFVMQMLYVCVHPVAVLNDAFCTSCSLFMLVEDASSHEHLLLFAPCCCGEYFYYL